MQTAALVTTEGTVDFFCCPRFDSPNVFASLLDAERGGHFSIDPAGDGYVTRQVALDRAIRLAERTGRPANIATWAIERDRLYNQIMERGWNEEAGTFTQHYATDVLDSSLLLMPLKGFIEARDPMWLSTLRAISARAIPPRPCRSRWIPL